MQLNKSNYFSREAEHEFMSRSQYKGFLECEAKQVAKLKGEWTDEVGVALMVGSYVHSWNDSTQREFISENPGMFKKDGSLKADYIGADKMIECLKNDEFAMYCLEGEKELIITFEMFGCWWKIMLDVQNNERRRIVYLKNHQEHHGTRVGRGIA